MGDWTKHAPRKRVFPKGFSLPAHSGTITVNSNAVTATVSTTSVKSDSLITATMLTGVGSGIGVDVGSRVDGVSFGVSITLADAAREHTIGWAILD